MDTLTSVSNLNRAGTTSNGAQSLSQLSDDYTQFLSLLTAQISNQDPLSPMDSTQFVAQLAQMSQVEQAVQTNLNLENLRADLGAYAVASGSQLIGQTVSVASNTVMLEDGQTDTYYRLGGEAAKVTAEIQDPLGRVIRTLSGLSGEANTHNPLTWDGRDDYGNPVLNGRYTVTITALDAEDKPLPGLVFRDAEIKEVMIDGGQMFFDVGGDEIVGHGSILAIR